MERGQNGTYNPFPLLFTGIPPEQNHGLILECIGSIHELIGAQAWG